MKEFLRTHRLALLLALIVGVCTVAPMLLAPLALGENYHGIEYMPLNDEDIYRARIQEILDGHYGVTSPFIFDYKDFPVVWPPINEWLYALPAFVFGLSAVIIASKFLLPATLFFLIYLLTRKLLVDDTRLSELSALAAGLVATLGISFVDYHYIKLFLEGKEHAPVMWTRLVNPITGGVEFFTFLMLLWFVWEKTRPYLFIAAGVLLALMIGYYFAFGMGVAVLGALFLAALYLKEFSVARQFVYIGLISVALDSWIWVNVFSSIGGEEGRVLAMRNGMFFTHEPVLNKALFLATLFVGACFVYTYVVKKRGEYLRSWLFLFALLGASWVAFNEQIITGRSIWHHHFVQYTVPISMLSVVVASYFTFKDILPRLLRLGMVGLIGVSLAYGVSCIGSYVRDMPWYSDDQRYGLLATWLNEKAPHDCVVLDVADDEFLGRHLPAYSGCNSYFTSVGYTGVPEERLIHNFHLNMALAGVTPDEAETYLSQHQHEVRRVFYPDWHAMFGWDDRPWIEERTNMLENSYQTFAVDGLENEMRKYRVDYVVSIEPMPPELLRALPSLTFKEKVGPYNVFVFE